LKIQAVFRKKQSKKTLDSARNEGQPEEAKPERPENY
jgi:hypothetical protein